jgi:hypothetical protein
LERREDRKERREEDEKRGGKMTEFGQERRG